MENVYFTGVHLSTHADMSHNRRAIVHFHMIEDSHLLLSIKISYIN